jgi:pyruvate/2-oxoglutarate dehydrogenase complex dihydrolipoamide acyltransferase (E2) component
MARFRRLRRLSAWRRISVHAWPAPSDPTVYGMLDIDVQNALEYVRAQSEASSVKVTLTHLIGKAVAEAIAVRPDVNAVIRRGNYFYQRDSIDIFFQVALDDGEDLSGAKVDGADKKSVVDIARELVARAEHVRARRDIGITRSSSRLSRIPGRLRGAAFQIGQYLSSDLGLNLSLLSIPYDAFGSAMITNVGMFGLPQGFAPLVSFARVPLVITVGSVERRPRVVADRIEIRPVVSIGVAFDHRLLDGYQAGQLARRFREVLEHPARALDDRTVTAASQVAPV